MDEISVAHLLGVSRSALKDLRLKKLALSANIRKQLIELAQEWAERRAEALLLQWLDEHGEELLVAASTPLPAASGRSSEEADQASVELRGEGAPDETTKEIAPLTAPLMRYEYLRSSQRHMRRAARR